MIRDTIERLNMNMADIVATHSCNRSCNFCIDGFRNIGTEIIKPEMGYKFLHWFKRFNNGAPVSDVMILGGEPGIIPMNDLSIIVALIKKFGFSAAITTNGSYPDSNPAQADIVKVSCMPDNYEEDFYPDDWWRNFLLPDFKSRIDFDKFIDKLDVGKIQYRFATYSSLGQVTYMPDWILRFYEERHPKPIFFGTARGTYYRGTIIKFLHKTKKEMAIPKLLPSGKACFYWDETAEIKF